MEGNLGLWITRAFQLIFAIVVLGVSAKLAVDVNRASDNCHDFYSDRTCDRALGRLPASSDYAAFTGAFGTLGALIGLVAAFVGVVPWFVALAFDGLAAIFFLAGGINSAVLRGEGSCDGDDFCDEWTASTAFMFLALIACLAAIVLGFLTRRSGSRTSAV